MIVVVGNVKGGVGKTTLAINFAIARAARGRDVLLIDGDEQGTALTFTALRSEQAGLHDYTAVALSGPSVRAQARQLAPKYDDLLIDVGGRDTGSLRAALTIADTLLIPFQPRTFDVWAIDHMRALIEDAATINEKLKAYSVLNAADAIGKDNEHAAAALRQRTNIHYLDCPLVRRKAFPSAAAQGKGVGEYTPRDPKAIDELNTLMAFIYQNDG
ncbi:MAG: AAA family ATPase [Candidatus Competibacter sp.]|nr:AAA family ATPase [Candidatus Competibacter sp.]